MTKTPTWEELQKKILDLVGNPDKFSANFMHPKYQGRISLWSEDIAKMMASIIQETEERALERGFTDGWKSSHEHDKGVEELVEKARKETEERVHEYYNESMINKDELVRELDVMMNGEEGAAKQASLCDIVGQFPDFIKETEERVRGEMREEIGKTVKKYISKDEQIFQNLSLILLGKS